MSFASCLPEDRFPDTRVPTHRGPDRTHVPPDPRRGPRRSRMYISCPRSLLRTFYGLVPVGSDTPGSVPKVRTDRLVRRTGPTTVGRDTESKGLTRKRFSGGRGPSVLFGHRTNIVPPVGPWDPLWIHYGGTRVGRGRRKDSWDLRGPGRVDVDVTPGTDEWSDR